LGDDGRYVQLPLAAAARFPLAESFGDVLFALFLGPAVDPEEMGKGLFTASTDGSETEVFD
jgi:hypothetical protein